MIALIWNTLSSVNSSLYLIRSYVRGTLGFYVACCSSFKDNVIGTLGLNMSCWHAISLLSLLLAAFFFTPLLSAQHNIVAITGLGGLGKWDMHLTLCYNANQFLMCNNIYIYRLSHLLSLSFLWPPNAPSHVYTSPSFSSGNFLKR